MSDPDVREDSEYAPLTKKEFRARFYEQYYDPAFQVVKEELERVFEIAWDGYISYRKSPIEKKAGKSFANPNFELPVEWLNTFHEIKQAQKKNADPASKTRVLLINGSARTQHSCPGEISKTRRLIQRAQEIFENEPKFEVDILDMSRLSEEPLKKILPCKACVSTAMPLCNWPCSCYPNHAMGQTQDWMNEIYSKWVAAHAIMIICPVHWYQAPASLKAMMDRLVCADGGNPDPTTTNGKDPKEAKKLELAGWHYPKHLAGRTFSIFSHGDAAGPENLRRMLSDWLTDMELIEAGPLSRVDSFIGLNKPYATSHQDLDENPDTFAEVENAARSLIFRTQQVRAGTYVELDLPKPRQK